MNSSCSLRDKEQRLKNKLSDVQAKIRAEITKDGGTLPSASTPLTADYKALLGSTIYHGNFLKIEPTGTVSTVSITTLPHDSTLLRYLTETKEKVTILQEDLNGNLSVVGNTAKADKANYKIVYEIMKYQPITVDYGDTLSVTYCVGISLRITASITTTSVNVDLSKIITSVGANGGSSNYGGTITIECKGIQSEKITNLIPALTSPTLTQDNIVAALQAMAAIKSHFSDRDVTIIPEVFGYYETTKTLLKNNLYQTVNSLKMLQ